MSARKLGGIALRSSKPPRYGKKSPVKQARHPNFAPAAAAAEKRLLALVSISKFTDIAGENHQWP